MMRNAGEGVVGEQDAGRLGQRIAAVDRAMQLLQLLIDRDELGVTEAAAQIGVAPSTAQRLLATMADRGFVSQTAARRYRLGDILAVTQRPGSRIAQLTARMRPVLQEVYEAVGETVHLSVLVGGDAQFVDGIEGGQALRIGLRIGMRVPAYCTSGGKAILAGFDPATVDALYRDGLPPWPGRRSATLAELHRELEEVRAAGVAYNPGESEEGVRALGVAIGRDERHPVGAIAVSLPSERFRRADRALLAHTLHTARDRAREVLE